MRFPREKSYLVVFLELTFSSNSLKNEKAKANRKKKNQDKQKAATKLIHKKQATIDPTLHTQEQDKMSIWEYNEFQLFLIHSCLTQKLKAMINT